MEPVAPRDTLEDSVLEVWETVLGTTGVGVRTSFLAAGGDEALAEAMLKRVEEMLSARIPLPGFLQDPTVEGLVAAIEEAQGEDLPAPFAAFLPVAGRGEAESTFFFVSDGSSLRLARSLGKELPTILLPYLAVDRPALESIEATAAGCLKTLRELQPRGPYRLGGFCLGALVAFEMARRLELEGETVEPLILVAPRPWSHRWLTRRRFGWLARLLRLSADREDRVFARLADLVPHWEARWRWYRGRGGHWLRRPASEKIAVVARKVRRGLRSLRRRPASAVGGRGPALPPSQAVAARRARHGQAWIVYKRVNRVYVPGRYSGRLTILWPESEPRNRPGYPDGVWRALVGAVDLHIVPGGHLTCLTRHVETLAVRVVACLAPAQVASAVSASESERDTQAPTSAAASASSSAAAVSGMPGAMVASDGRDGSRQASTANSALA
jgi:thioesterase domain-containing protein